MTARVVKPAEILAGAQADVGARRVAEQVLRRTQPGGTPFSKTRNGYVTAFDPDTWTVTALVGDTGTEVPGIPVLAGVTPAVECAAQFAEVSAGSKTEYTLTGVLLGGPTAARLRTEADQTMTNSAGPVSDAYLRFRALAGRAYLYTARLIVSQNSINDMDFKLGWSLPSGATWSGGGIGPIQTVAAGTATESTGAGGNWRALAGAVVSMLPYGVEVSAVNGTEGPADLITFTGSIKMGANDGTCALTWGQRNPLTATTRIRQGSTLAVDMTHEYTL